jgi:ATP-dependent RNA helicase RhlE
VLLGDARRIRGTSCEGVHEKSGTPRIRVHALKPSENVRLQAVEVSADGKQEMLCHLLAQERGRCLVFSRTKRGTERIAKNLNRQGINAAMIHGDRSQSQRTAALSGFQRGQYRVLVATDVAARGIHVQDIAHAINHDLP